MYVDLCKYKRWNKTYKRVLLREGYREGGKVKHRTLANLSHCSDEEIEAIGIVLKGKKQIVYGLLTDRETHVATRKKLNSFRKGKQCQIV